MTTPPHALTPDEGQADISPDFRFSKLDAMLIANIARHAESPKAIRSFSNEHRKLSDYAYWFVLGTLWVSYTGFSDIALWRRLFSSTRPNRATSLMKPSEYNEWQRLPDALTVYRAHRPDETDWIAYTLIPQKAGMFAQQRGVSKVVEYSCLKSDALCVFLRRGEAEVLVLDKFRAAKVREIEVVVQ